MAHQLLGLDLITRYVEKLGSELAFPDALRTSIGWYLVRSIRRKMADGTKPISGLTRQNRRKGSDASKPLQDSGKLRLSIKHELVNEGVEVGSNLVYAPIHQFGGWIRPKNAQKLAIPATPTAARWAEALGVRGALEAFRRNWGPITFGPGAIFCDGEPVFWRIDEVRIPRRPYLNMTSEREKHIEKMVQNYIESLKV